MEYSPLLILGCLVMVVMVAWAVAWRIIAHYTPLIAQIDGLPVWVSSASKACSATTRDELGLDAIICTLPYCLCWCDYERRCLQLNMADRADYDISNALTRVVMFDAEHDLRSRRLLVHCNAGRRRSAAVAVWVLMCVHGYSQDDAMRAVTTSKPNTRLRWPWMETIRARAKDGVIRDSGHADAT